MRRRSIAGDWRSCMEKSSFAFWRTGMNVCLSSRLATTLQPTALVHEAWLRLGADAQPAWQNRAHFFAAAAEAMRRILVDRARRRTAVKRGGGADHVSLDAVEIPIVAPDDERLLAVDDA